MAIVDDFHLNGTDSDHSGVTQRAEDHAEFLTLFRRWESMRREYNEILEIPDLATETAINAAFDRICDVAREIAARPAQGVTGMAIKLFLRHHEEHPFGPWGDLGLCTPIEGAHEFPIIADLERSLIADVARLVPELATLCTRALTPLPDEVERQDEIGSEQVESPALPPVFEGSEHETATGDRRILKLFAEWQVAERASSAISRLHPNVDNHPDVVSARDKAADLLEEINEERATGHTGLAIKFYIALLGAIGNTHVDPCKIGFAPDDERDLTQIAAAAGIRDAGRLVPELTALCEGV
jgi:hypothetical protein